MLKFLMKRYENVVANKSYREEVLVKGSKGQDH